MPSNLDSIDQQIISALQLDGRVSNVEIARQVGVSEATVRKRLDRLISDRVIQIAAIPDAAQVGFPTITFLSLDVDLSQVDRIADQVSRLPEVRSVHYTTGESDLIVEAWFSSSDDLLSFLTQHIASIPGIKRVATSHVLRTIKDGSRWVLPPASPPQILVVDDDPDFIEVVRLMLAAEGFEVVSTNNGEEALASMRVRRPDLVILDIMMRGVLDGIKTGQEIRSNGDLRSVPILMVSSISDTTFSRLLPAQELLPADNFMTKPIEPAVLVAEVRRLIRSR
jgi:Lrp/AsnC family transcriptional regulator for asnA, asnC and gidA